MPSRNFTARVKEREADQPCFIVLEDLCIGGASLVLEMKEATGLPEAKALAARLNEHVSRIEPMRLRVS